MKALSRLVLALLLLTALSGCVWLRLLDLKNQLARFDENFATEVSDHFTLNFKHPVLLAEDFVELAKLEPTRKESTPEGGVWRQFFHKLDAQGKVTPGIDIVFTLSFDREQKLTHWDFSHLFMTMVPAQFFEASLRSLGKGKVDESRRKFRVDDQDLPKITVKPPTLEKIRAALGEPTETGMDKGRKLLIYRFLVDTPHLEKNYEDRRIAVTKLYFDPASGELLKMGGKFLGLKLSIDFLKLGEQRPPLANREH
jgi:hypothetical protein